jgi:hypothetical protein
MLHDIRGIAQPGSAAVLGTAGRWFESSCPDHKTPSKTGISCAPLVLGVEREAERNGTEIPRTPPKVPEFLPDFSRSVPPRVWENGMWRLSDTEAMIFAAVVAIAVALALAWG